MYLILPEYVRKNSAYAKGRELRTLGVCLVCRSLLFKTKHSLADCFCRVPSVLPISVWGQLSRNLRPREALLV